MRKMFILLIGTAVLVYSGIVYASVSDDQVTSQKIREADGTSGQNTNSGSGVKTGHIQDGAVTDAKISGPISASKISSIGLNADTVDGMHAADLAPAIHGHASSQVTGLDAALASKAEVLHYHDSLYQQKYGKIAVVAQTGGDYADPVSAMNALAAWCGVPSAANPCLLKVMPGVYDIASATLALVPFVDMEGSGENVTRIKGSVNGSIGTGVLSVTGPNVEVRSIAVENNSQGGAGTIAVMVVGSGSARLMNVTAIAAGGGNAYGISSTMAGTLNLVNVNASCVAASWTCAGVSTYHGPSILNMVGGTAAGLQGNNAYGVIFRGGGTTAHVLDGVTVTASNGYHNAGVFHGPVSIKNSKITGSGGAGQNVGIQTGDETVLAHSEVAGVVALTSDGAALGTYKVAHSKVDGALGSSYYTCIGAYNAAYAPLDATCR